MNRAANDPSVFTITEKGLLLVESSYYSTFTFKILIRPLVGAFSAIVKTDGMFTALHYLTLLHYQQREGNERLMKQRGSFEDLKTVSECTLCTVLQLHYY